MANYAIIDTNQTPQKVINVIDWDGDEKSYDIHAGHGVSDGLIAVQSDVAARGYIYDPVALTFTNQNQNEDAIAVPPADPVPSA